MRHRLLTQIFTAAAIALGIASTLDRPSYAGNINFFCGKYQGTPATLVQPIGKSSIPLILWTYAQGKYKPQQRCQSVSERFQKYYKNGTLDYLTTGVVNGQAAICVARSWGGPCKDLLFTPKPGSDANNVLKQLLDSRVFASSPLNQSDRPQCRNLTELESYISNIGGRTFVNVEKYLKALDSYSDMAPTDDPCLRLENLHQ